MTNTEPLYEVRKIKDIKDMFYSSVELYGDKCAFMIKDTPGGPYREISYNEFKDDVEAFGSVLIEMGLKGKRIAIMGENRYELAVAYMAIVNGVGVVVPFDKELPAEEIANLMKISEVSAFAYSGKFKNKIQNIITEDMPVKHFINMDIEKDSDKELSFHWLIKRGQVLLKEGYEGYKNIKIDPEVMSILLFTSGTTGLSKGVMLCHRNIASNLMSMCAIVHIKPSDIFFSVLPMHHTYECTCGFLTPIYRGSAIAYCEGLKYILKNMEEAKPTMFLSVPLIFEGIYKKIWRQAKANGVDKKLKKAIRINKVLNKCGIDLSKKFFKKIHHVFGGRMRMLISGGAALDPEVAKGYNDLGILTFQGYGLTESSPIVAVNPDIKPKHASAGIPTPGVEVKIDQANEDGIGEIIAKSDSIMMGYYNNPEATNEVLKDGWYHTGDLGYIDDENYIYITGRKKNVIVTKNGKNIFPEELEFYLNRSDYIEESMVWGRTDENSGETYINAQIKVMDEMIEEALGSDYSDEMVHRLIQKEVDQINKDLPFYKKIRKINIKKGEFAKTTTKKIKRHLEVPAQ